MINHALKTDPKMHDRQIWMLTALTVLVFGSIIVFLNYSAFAHRYSIDKLFHVTAGLFVYAIFRPYAKNSLVAVLAVFIIGILWEGVEYMTLDILPGYGSVERYITDTIGDLIADVLGPILILLKR
ncbi:MAG: hypothetical protein AAB944_02380 [Patescibacteria group bacterium]